MGHFVVKLGRDNMSGKLAAVLLSIVLFNCVQGYTILHTVISESPDAPVPAVPDVPVTPPVCADVNSDCGPTNPCCKGLVCMNIFIGTRCFPKYFPVVSLASPVVSEEKTVAAVGQSENAPKDSVFTSLEELIKQAYNSLNKEKIEEMIEKYIEEYTSRKN